MCFSATASFTLFATLVPLGGAAVLKARNSCPSWVPFALYPLAFGIQQGFEGLVWIGMQQGNQLLVDVASRGFLFFSHFFWLAWVPISVWLFETDPERKRILAILSWVGGLYGVSIAAPALLLPDWLWVEIVNRSLDYKTVLLYEGLLNRTILKLIYAAIVVGALVMSRHKLIQLFGVLVAVSLIATTAFYAYAFISVWCFFAAILSLYLVAAMSWDQRSASAPQN